MNDFQYMERAIEISKFGEFTTSPNPNVGCVIVKNNIIIGEGWHQKTGENHAEINALNIA
ncbi:riboflavin biosynthesis protein RibD, partial [Buchnera aphidicola]|nr:riboflavin biosynthesis protein RibD [Buchnera aphidicola]